ncbi:MAG: amino acid permease [Saprospiraceae bacterium]|nr:amino acid permease [Saprospiraceae bacterium]
MSDRQEHQLQRSLGLLDGTLLVAGGMIGSGIFIVSADCARMVGSSGWLLLLWLAAGAITIMAALSYGELAGMMPKAGGQFVYIEKAYGQLPAFLYGWTVFTVIQTGTIAAVAVAFAKYSAYFFPALGPQNVLLKIGSFTISAGQLFAIAMIALLTFVNSRGLKAGKAIQLVFTTAKILALLALIVLGLAVGLQTDVFAQNWQSPWAASQTVLENGQWVTHPLVGFGLLIAFGTALIGPLFSSDAWNNVTFVAGEMKNPRRNIPLSLLFGVCLVTALYLMANIAYLALLPLQGSPEAADAVGQGIQFAGYSDGVANDRVGTAAGSMIFGGLSAAIMAALIMVSTFGCNNGLILAGARVYYVMAQEGLFLKKAGTLNRFDVPGTALVAQAVWASLLCLSGTYGALLTYCTFASLVFYMVTIGGIFILRRKEPDAERPYRVIGYPVLPVLYILLAGAVCAILLFTAPQNTWPGVAIVLLGIPVYYWQKSRQKLAG